MVTNGVGDEMLITEALANQGPLSVAIFVNSLFQHYSSGVLTYESCPGRSINHAVNLVGYGTLDKSDYYILRNSWGSSWGQNGYMYYKRDTIGNTNQCFVASYASYPIVLGKKPITKSASTKTQTTSTRKTTLTTKTTTLKQTTTRLSATKTTAKTSSSTTTKLILKPTTPSLSLTSKKIP